MLRVIRNQTGTPGFVQRQQPEAEVWASGHSGQHRQRCCLELAGLDVGFYNIGALIIRIGFL